MIYNNTKKRWTNSNRLCRGIVYINSEYVEFGFFEYNPTNIPIAYRGRLVYLDDISHSELPLFWSNSSGCYVLDISHSDNTITYSKHIFHYPIDKCYNFSKLHLSPSSIVTRVDDMFSSLSQFTFGLEYETSGGNIPWLDCLKNNLVPLYDGSITGHEYVTFPMSNNELSLISQHLRLLQRYTKFNKDCSLHVHIGGFPISYDSIERLCNYWKYFQHKIEKYIPVWSYYVEEYKDSGKAYNKPLEINSLVDFYQETTDNVYINEQSFYLPNSYDTEEEHKWSVCGRYYNMNIMHLISGGEHKTVEFRFLRPTIHYSEIKWYIMVLAGFLKFVIESKEKTNSSVTVNDVINFAFSKDIANKLISEGKKLYHLRKIQENKRDYAGIDESLKDLYLFKICNFDL